MEPHTEKRMAPNGATHRKTHGPELLPHKFTPDRSMRKRACAFTWVGKTHASIIRVYEFVWQFNYTSGKGVLQVNVVEIGKKSAVEYVLHRKICSVIIRRHHLKNKVIHTAYQLTSQALHNRFF